MKELVCLANESGNFTGGWLGGVGWWTKRVMIKSATNRNEKKLQSSVGGLG